MSTANALNTVILKLNEQDLRCSAITRTNHLSTYQIPYFLKSYLGCKRVNRLWSYPMKTKRKRVALSKAPRLLGDNIPNMAKPVRTKKMSSWLKEESCYIKVG